MASASGKPNIVFFMVDQLSAKWLEGEAARACPTPNLDQLRAQGTTFTRAFTSNPVCMPARATLATGLTTRGHGVLQNGYDLDPELPTFMRLLQGAGWRTGALGKVHLITHYRSLHPDYRSYGFDVAHNTEDTRAGEWLDWVEREHPEHYEAALATASPLDMPEMRAYGPAKIDLRARIAEIRRNFHWATEAHPYNTPDRYTLPFPEKLSQTAWITSHALDFIRSTSVDQPICAHISYVAPHIPHCPPAAYLEHIHTEHIPVPIEPEWVDDPQQPTWFRFSARMHLRTPDDWRLTRQFYLADVACLDHYLGLVIDALQDAGRWRDTYFFFLSDHGDLLLDHGFGGKMERHYDACVRVPLVIAGPGIEQGHRCEAIVQLEDICPTVLEMAEIPYPEPRVVGSFVTSVSDVLPGRSLLAWCRGEQVAGWRDRAYIESYNCLRSTLPWQWARTVRTDQWRYTLYPQGQGEQLFHLSEDPDETVNLAHDSAYSQVRCELRDLLLESIILQDYPHTPRGRFALGAH